MKQRRLQKLFLPPTTLMDRLSYPYKFTIIFLAMLIPLLALSFNLVNYISNNVSTLERKIIGLNYIALVRLPVEHIQQHRGMMAANLSGSEQFGDRLTNKRITISRKLEQLFDYDDQFNKDFSTQVLTNKIKQQWQEINAPTSPLDASASLDNHNEMINNLLLLMAQVADKSGLSLDSRLESYHLSQVLIYNLPKMLESMGQARALATSTAAKGGFDNQADFIQLSLFANNIDSYFSEVHDHLQLAYAEHVEFSDSLLAAIEANHQAVTAMHSLLFDGLLNAASPSISSDQIFSTSTHAITDSYALYDTLLPKLHQLLISSIDSNITARTFILSVVISMLVGIIYLFLGFYFSVFQSVSLIRRQANKLAEGDFSTRISLLANDEMRYIANDFNAMALNLDRLNQQTLQQQWLQEGVNQLNNHLQGNLSLEKLASNTIGFLCRYLDIAMGSFYVVNQQQLHFVGSYALNALPVERRVLQLGEGMIGQAALDQQRIEYTDIPKEYLQINSVLGDITPQVITIDPLVWTGEVVAVLEFGSFQTLQARQQQLLNMVAPAIAIAVKTSATSLIQT